MSTILDKIVTVKRREVAALVPRAEELRGRAAARKDFRTFTAALRGAVGTPRPTNETVGRAVPSPPPVSIALIAEVKKASPSAGVICPDFDPVRIARAYEQAGAAAISVLTDREFFQGNIEYLQQIRAVVKLPLLRKDFIIEELQIYEAAACGADAVLLIAAILDDQQLRDFRAIAEHLQLAALVEVHDEIELDRALAAGAHLIGINNRNLATFTVSLATTEKLAARISNDRLIVAESGIHTRADVERVARAGAKAILVGESLMRSGDIAGKVKELIG
ncbi:MAG: indole-3-glycerol phosphate synthase TrpC [Verrucomicrobia bacterium]|nr:indole-3-glycerol phosphate synthase TrpC [Verrucomicrobiota bacterium]